MAAGDRRRWTDRLGLTRRRDAKPYTWPAALTVGLCWGLFGGVTVGFLQARHGFTFAPLAIWVPCGLLLYAPGIHWGSYRRWQRATNTPNDGR